MPTTLNILPAIAERLARYAAADIPTIVYEQDDMFKPGGMDRYLAVGRSAIEVIARAMLTAGRTEIKSVLDLPSGAGRVTRHLRVFFPEAELFVCDIVTEKAAFAAKHFGATYLEPVPLFDTPSKRKFDLIFVGSLLTHLDEEICRAALRWLSDALNDDGLLIVTTAGRRQMHVGRVGNDQEWSAIYADVIDRGFNFWPDGEPLKGQVAYGSTHSTPSWIMKVIERNEGVMIIGFQEAGWTGLQDVTAVMKRSYSGGDSRASAGSRRA